MLSDGVLVDQGPLEQVLARCDEMRALWFAVDETVASLTGGV